MCTTGDCCRLTHALRAAEAEFGPNHSWWELARRAVSHGAHSPVIDSFLLQWELMLHVGADGLAGGPAVCDTCLGRLGLDRALPHQRQPSPGTSAGQTAQRA